MNARNPKPWLGGCPLFSLIRRYCQTLDTHIQSMTVQILGQVGGDGALFCHTKQEGFAVVLVVLCRHLQCRPVADVGLVQIDAR